jgi:hypothetical protein
MLIFHKVYVEWLEIRTCWNLENCGFSICTCSTTSWTNWDDYVATVASFVMKTTCSTDIIGSSWMLLITWSKLGSSFSSMLSCVVVASSYFPPLLPISLE